MLPKRRKPTHPGVVLLEDFLKPLNLTERKLAEMLGDAWSETKVHAIIQGKENLSQKTANAFAAIFETTPEFWMRLQNQFNHSEEIERQDEKGAPKHWKKAQ
jgi:addiction module HigA family antidote